ncbi:MAG: B12-binding domain-containing radical SAM protein, partial [Clostridia bacterium]|nr:B12-binding domain-containing radical SAM protein [Clostridia bacterium]
MYPKEMEKLLLKAQKPGRYVGGEPGEVIKDKSKVFIRFAFCFPDTYEIGMSHLGIKILYGLYNSQPDTWCERVFAPWTDMEELMRSHSIPLYGLESGDAINDFDFLGFTLQYELSYTNMLNMLDLAGVPLRGEQRPDLTPLVIAGGTAMYNCEPIADFIDLALLGEGEEQIVEVIELYRQAKREDWDKHTFLCKACHLDGVYVPSLYDVT